jgi:hypothetical protein
MPLPSIEPQIPGSPNRSLAVVVAELFGSRIHKWFRPLPTVEKSHRNVKTAATLNGIVLEFS